METMGITTSLETIISCQKKVVNLLLEKGFAVVALRPEEEWTAEVLPSIIAGEMVRNGYIPKTISPGTMAVDNITEGHFVILRHPPRIPSGIELIQSLRGRVPMLVIGTPEEVEECELGNEALLLPIEKE